MTTHAVPSGMGILAAAATLLALSPSAAFGAGGGSTAAETTVKDAILYAIDGTGTGKLEYNVTHTATVDAGTKVSDPTGTGVDTLGELSTVMGTPDKPALRFGTDPGTRTLGKAVTADLTIGADGTVDDIAVDGVQTRPVMGISWKSDTIGSDYQGFAEAYERNGAYAVYLPQVSDEAGAAKVLHAIDGIFMTGGEDWNPALYGQTQTPYGSSFWNDPRDASDLALMKQAIALDVPMFTVCRGTQGFTISRGGALIQDVPAYLGQQVLDGKIDVTRVSNVLSGTIPSTLPGYDKLPDALKQTVTGTYRKYDAATGTFTKVEDSDTLRVNIDGIVHSGGTGYHELAGGVGNEGVAVSKDSKWLYQILGTDSLQLVATAHHQAVDPEQLGNGLTVVARSSDGIVEAVEYQAASYALGLQWHPERDALKDTRGVDVDQDQCNLFLRALVKHAAVKAGYATSADSGTGTTDGTGAEAPTTPAPSPAPTSAPTSAPTPTGDAPSSTAPVPEPTASTTAGTGTTPTAQVEAEHPNAALADTGASTATIAGVTAVMLAVGFALFAVARANRPGLARGHEAAGARTLPTGK